ncbi:hypothetical protein [Lentzea sp. NPDC004782]|uniref:hypothetical protein n=1 Tax=Lentzea sp. NPDC004782 TaxID=3154458 RepID=UPI0033B22BCA
MRVLTRQLPQIPDLWWRDDTRTDQIVLGQLGQPLDVLDDEEPQCSRIRLPGYAPLPTIALYG